MLSLGDGGLAVRAMCAERFLGAPSSSCDDGRAHLLRTWGVPGAVCDRGHCYPQFRDGETESPQEVSAQLPAQPSSGGAGEGGHRQADSRAHALGHWPVLPPFRQPWVVVIGWVGPFGPGGDGGIREAGPPTAAAARCLWGPRQQPSLATQAPAAPPGELHDPWCCRSLGTHLVLLLPKGVRRRTGHHAQCWTGTCLLSGRAPFPTRVCAELALVLT